MKWYFYLIVFIVLIGLSSFSANSYTTNNNTFTFEFELNESYSTVNNTFTLTFELNESGETPSTDTCSGTENCVVTCGNNFTIATGSVDMNDFNISFDGTGTTYLLANISNYTRISIGGCNIKLNNMRIN